jgi:PKD repeat protein
VKAKKHSNIARNIEIVGIIIIIIVLIITAILRYKEPTGKAFEQLSDTYIEGFDSSPLSSWNPSTIQISTIDEEALNKSFTGIDLDPSTSLEIPLSSTQFNQDKGILWFRIKLDNSNYDQSEFLPIMLIGNLLLFKGSTEEGHIDLETLTGTDYPIENGQDIFLGSYYSSDGVSSRYYKELGTWKKDEWHEVMISWEENIGESDCGGIEQIVTVRIDGEVIPANAAVDCDSDCSSWTMWFCEDDLFFPILPSDKLVLMPEHSSLSLFSIDSSAQTSSGFFIDKLAISKASINDFIYEMNDETITSSNFPYWQSIEEKISIDNSPQGQILIEDITSKCKLFNKPEEYGDVNIDSTVFDDFQLSLSGDDLVISDITQDVSTRKNFYIGCTNEGLTSERWIKLEIGSPEIFEFYFIESQDDSLDVIMEKNSKKTISYYIQHVDIDSMALQHDVTGESIVTEQHYPTTRKLAGNHLINLSSGTTTGAETLDLKITNPNNPEEFVEGTINVNVLGDNLPPTVNIISPQQSNVQIEVGQSIDFQQQSTDDISTFLYYYWYLDGLLENPQNSQLQTYTFTGNQLGNYTIRLVVSDQTLTTNNTWTIEVVAESNQNDQNNNSSSNNNSNDQSQAVCGNNIVEDPEECDGSDHVCGGFVCLSDCTCAKPSQNNDTQDNQQDNNDTQTQDSDTQDSSTTQSSDSSQSPSQSSSSSQSSTTQQSSSTTQSSSSSQTSPQSSSSSTTQQSNTKTPKKTTKPKTIDKKSPPDTLFNTLLWIFLGLCVIPFIIIGSSKLSNIQKRQGAVKQIPNADYNYQKLVNIVQWYKAKC